MTTRTQYSFQDEQTKLFWDGCVTEPKFSKEPHHWIKQSQAELRYTDYLVMRCSRAAPSTRTRSAIEAVENAPDQLTLVVEQVVTTLVERRVLPPIANVWAKLAKFRHLLGQYHSYEFEDFRKLIRSTPNVEAYQFLVKASHDYISKIDRSRNVTGYVKKPESLAQIVRSIVGPGRSKVVGLSIFVKDQRDLVAMRLQGEIPIVAVFDLHSVERIYSGADW